MKKALLILTAGTSLILFPTVANAVYPVSDEIAQAIAQQNGMQEIAKLTEGLQKTQQLINYAEQARAIAGDPTKALGAISGLAGITPANDMGKSMDQLADLGSTASNLSNRVQKLYRPLDLKNPLNSAGLKSDNPYAQFQAVEGAFSQYESQLTKSQATAKSIRKAIDDVNKKVSTTEAEQRQKQADLAALQVKLIDAQKEESEAYNALQAQKTLNDSMAEKATKNNWEATKTRVKNSLIK